MKQLESIHRVPNGGILELGLLRYIMEAHLTVGFANLQQAVPFHFGE